jgi:DNA-binding IclR family transcriptional regulator
VMGMMPSIGSRWPAHASSTGKVLLAHMSAEMLADTLEQPLDQLTPHTITNLSRLSRQLAQVREQGYATASDELELGYSDVAAPIFDQGDQAMAALAVGGATMRMTGDKRAAVAKLVRESARRVCRQLGHWL